LSQGRCAGPAVFDAFRVLHSHFLPEIDFASQDLRKMKLIRLYFTGLSLDLFCS
jgi:hypothetical protein